MKQERVLRYRLTIDMFAVVVIVVLPHGAFKSTFEVYPITAMLACAVRSDNCIHCGKHM
jgi:hypothetical protein